MLLLLLAVPDPPNLKFVLIHASTAGTQGLRRTSYSGWIQLCVRAQPCMQGSGDAAYLLCMLCCLYLQWVETAAVAKFACVPALHAKLKHPTVT
jgi:hypothetical protein